MSPAFIQLTEADAATPPRAWRKQRLEVVNRSFLGLRLEEREKNWRSDGARLPTSSTIQNKK